VAAALILCIQLAFDRQGRTSPLAGAISTAAALAGEAISTVGGFSRGAVGSVTQIPALASDNARLRAENRKLRGEDAALRERLAVAPAEARIASAAERYPRGIEARIIGYDPENALRVVTIDHGSRAGVVRYEGVVNDDGVVGTVVEVGPFTSKVLLLTDVKSYVPAVVQRGRWWGIAKGTLSRVQLQYVSQDAPLHAGDMVVTGEGRTFRDGIPVGRIVAINHAEGGLYQSATVEPAVTFGALERVIVLPK
jgi:rod shape-determining protein MreC